MPLLRAACVRNIALTAVQQYVLRSSALAPYTIQRARQDGKRRLQRGGAAAGTAREAIQQQGQLPWNIGFQVRERQVQGQFEDGATVQLLKLHVAQRAGRGLPWVEARLGELVALVPDIVAKLPRVKADLLFRLVSDTPGIAQKMVAYEALLPAVDLSALAARYPALLLEHTPATVSAQLARLREALPGHVSLARLVAVEPVLLEVDIAAVLADTRRLLPGEDPVRVLLRDPSMVLDMKAFKMGSSLQDTQ